MLTDKKCNSVVLEPKDVTPLLQNLIFGENLWVFKCSIILYIIIGISLKNTNFNQCSYCGMTFIYNCIKQHTVRRRYSALRYSPTLTLCP